MDEDFPSSPAKRQRTMSPAEPMQKPASNTDASVVQDKPPMAEENSFLDVLMQHVEAESTPIPHSTAATIVPEPAAKNQPTLHVAPPVVSQNLAEEDQAIPDAEGEIPVSHQGEAKVSVEANRTESTRTVQSSPHAQTIPSAEKANGPLQPEVNGDINMSTASDNTESGLAEATSTKTQPPTEPASQTGLAETTQNPTPQPQFASKPSRENPHTQSTDDENIATSTHTEQLSVSEQVEAPANGQSSAQVDSIPVEETMIPDTAEGAEWEIDSSPYESSSDSDSSDSTSSEDSDEDGDADYAMLGPEEQARILMQGDGGSDDEGNKSKEKGDNAVLRTANERPEEIIPMPSIVVTEDMKIEELGAVEATVESTVLVKAKVSGEYQVLESGSLLCLSDRTVIGLVSETLGRVEQPLYTIRFTNDQAIEDAGVSVTGTTVFYVVPHSTFVFTQPLKTVKGSDASNFHDEEVGDDEMEFSDDEAEAEHKRQMKLKRQGRREDTGRGRGGRGGRSRGNRQGSSLSHSEPSASLPNGSLDYDDNADEGYTPLARPTNLHEMMGQSDPREGSSFTHPLPPPPPTSRGGFNKGHRGRGNRGGYRGGRGGSQYHGNPQNGYANPPGYSTQSNNQTYQPHPQHQPPMGPPQAFSFQPYPQYPPHAPSLPPQSGMYSTPFSPSPISPLPKQQFDFDHFQQPPPPSAMSYGGGYQPPSQAAAYPYQQQPPAHFPMNPGYAANSSNVAPAWANNEGPAQQVQRQLEELRKMQQQSKS